MNITDLITTFGDRFGDQPSYFFRAPGRVNLLGEHVDYNEGPVLPAAIDRAVYLAAKPNKSAIVQLVALDLGEEISFSLERLDQKKDLEGHPLPGWALYPAGVSWALQNAGKELQGIQAVYSSDVPIGAGLSSSAAIEMVFGLTWQTLGDWSVERMTLAQLCQRAENEYVGVASGLMDQFASGHGVAGHAMYFDTRSLDWEPIPLPPDTALIVADSGVRRKLTNSAYNERRAACEKAVKILRLYLPHTGSLRDVSPAEFDQFRHNLPPTEQLRAEHVIYEIERVHSAVNALRDGDKDAFGKLMFAGHSSLRDLYEVSTPELDSLVEIARGQTGCIGARLTGAGFGGCTINLVEETHAEDFIQGLQAGYRRVTGRRSNVYLCEASQGASVIEFHG